MSAFANTLGGALIFGMADDGQIVGLTEPDSDAEKISEILKTRMEPIPEFRLRFHKIDDGKVLLILDVFKGEETPYPVLCTLSADGCTAHVPDFPKVTAQAPTLDAALLEVKQQIQKALRQYKNPPIPTKQDQIVVPTNGVLVLVKAG